MEDLEIIKSELVAPENSVYTVVLMKENRELKCFLKEIDKKTLSNVLSNIYNNKDNFNISDAGEMILRSCFVGGDSEFLSDDKVIVSASMYCYGLINLYQGELKKN